jgi:hypothetical protein
MRSLLEERPEQTDRLGAFPATQHNLAVVFEKPNDARALPWPVPRVWPRAGGFCARPPLPDGLVDKHSRHDREPAYLRLPSSWQARSYSPAPVWARSSSFSTVIVVPRSAIMAATFRRQISNGKSIRSLDCALTVAA